MRCVPQPLGIDEQGREVLEYVEGEPVGDAFPWTTSRGEQTLQTLRRLITEEGRAIAALGQYLVRCHLSPPYLGNYPSSFTTINFLSLDYILPRLVEHERQSLAELERGGEGRRGEPAGLEGAEGTGQPAEPAGL